MLISFFFSNSLCTGVPCKVYHLSLYLPSNTSQSTATHQELHALHFFEQCVGSLKSHIEFINVESICETGPTVYSPYQRRLESLTMCRM